MPRDYKRDKIASYVVGAPWPGLSDNICTYALHGSVVFNGTLEEANKTLSYVKERIISERKFAEKYGQERSWDMYPKPEDYQIYQLVPINSAE